MKVTMTVAITKPGLHVVDVEKEVDLPFAPNIGMKICCPMWDSGRKVENATLYFDPDYKVEYLCLYMGRIETKDEEELNLHIKAYKAADWIFVE